MKTLITVHSTNTVDSVNLKLSDLDRRDRQHGFARVGYHYAIRRDGKIEEGRTESEASVHDGISLAKQAISVCLVGGAGTDGSPVDNFTDEQWQGLTQLLSRLLEDYPKAEIRAITPALTTELVVAKFGKILSQWSDL